jgi:putative inorganic carbon (HCO3(-)) transporter
LKGRGHIKIGMKNKAIKIADRVVEYCLYGLILFIPISAAGTEIFAVLAIISFIVKKILKPELNFIKSRPNLFLLLFIIFCGFSLFNSGPFLKISVRALFSKWLEYVLIFLAVGDTLADRKRLRNTVVIFLLMGGLVGIDSISQRFLGIEFLRHRSLLLKKQMGEYTITGPFKHYNSLATYLVCVLPLMVALPLIEMKKRIYRVGLLLGATLLILCLLLSISRGGWSGFMAGMLLMLFLSHKYRRILPVICIFILLIMLIPITRERVEFTIQTEGVQSEGIRAEGDRYRGDADRFLYWDGALKMIKENPFLGKGLGTYMRYVSNYVPRLHIHYAHNCFLQIWAETGIFALLSFLLFVGSVLYRAIRVFRRSVFRRQPLKDKSSGMVSLGENPYLLLGLICATFGFLVHSFFDVQLYSLQLSVLFWVMLGMTLTLADSINLSDKKE